MDLALRVARRFQAELLSKQWLMGVRRGWLSLLKPSVSDWDDVIRAIDKLSQFVENLEAQVFFVRRGPSTFSPNMENGEQIRKLFKRLKDDLKEQRSSAKFWMQIHTNTSPVPSGSHKPEDGAHMLKLYKDDFASLMTTYVKTRRPGGNFRVPVEREAGLTEILDKILDLLRKDAKRIQDALEAEVGLEDREDFETTRKVWGDPVFKEFSYGRMKVVVTDAKSHGAQIKSYVRYIDKAWQLLKRKGFEKLWYGVMFIESTELEKLTDPEIAAYEALGYKDLRNRAGRYHTGADIFVLTQPPKPWVADSIVHELGHRYWYKFMSQAQRERFESLVRVNVPGEEKRKAPPPPLSKQEIESATSVVSKSEKELERALTFAGNFKPKTLEEVDGVLENVLGDFLNTTTREFLQDIHNAAYALLGSDMDPADDLTLKNMWKAVVDEMGMLEAFLMSKTQVNRIKKKVQESPTSWEHQFDSGRAALLTLSRKQLRLVSEVVEHYFVAIGEARNRIAEERAEKEEAFLRGKPVLPVSRYGKSHIREAFAEAFTWYVYGRDMDRDQIESFREVLASDGPPKTEVLFMEPLRRELCGSTYSYSRS